MDFRGKGLIDGLPLVTIGILSYNYSAYISGALGSLLEQTYPNIELLIIDDCSTEPATRTIIKEWIQANKIVCDYVENDENMGITRVSNMIVKRARGKYISLFATDDIMLPEKIARQVAILEEAGDEYGMCYANAEKMDEEGTRLGLYNPNMTVFEGDALGAYVYRKLLFVTPTALIRRSVYERVGMYDERVIFEDYNFWLRLMACYKVRYCDYSCLIYREKKNSPVYDQIHNNNNERYFRDRILSNLQGLKYIPDKPLRQYLQKKNDQYLKSLTANNAACLDEMQVFLLKTGHLYLGLKLFALRLYRRVQKLLPI